MDRNGYGTVSKKDRNRHVIIILSVLLLVLAAGLGILPGAAEGTEGVKLADFTPVEGAENTYAISTAEELANLSEYVNNGNKCGGMTFVLQNDIDLLKNDKTVSWIPIGNSDDTPFGGTFDGGNHVISNLRIETNKGDYSGFFGRLSSEGSLKNIIIKNIYRLNQAITEGKHYNLETKKLDVWWDDTRFAVYKYQNEGLPSKRIDMNGYVDKDTEYRLVKEQEIREAEAKKAEEERLAKEKKENYGYWNNNRYF